MLLVTCPNCGPRNESEFRFGGEVNSRPPASSALAESDWTAFLYTRKNKSGLETEWWYHRFGCGLWFLAERNTITNQMMRTYVWTSQDKKLS